MASQLWNSTGSFLQRGKFLQRLGFSIVLNINLKKKFSTNFLGYLPNICIRLDLFWSGIQSYSEPPWGLCKEVTHELHHIKKYVLKWFASSLVHFWLKPGKMLNYMKPGTQKFHCYSITYYCVIYIIRQIENALGHLFLTAWMLIRLCIVKLVQPKQQPPPLPLCLTLVRCGPNRLYWGRLPYHCYECNKMLAQILQSKVSRWLRISTAL